MGLLVGKVVGALVGLELLGLLEGVRVGEDVTPLGGLDPVGL